jgi:hypothetical protein
MQIKQGECHEYVLAAVKKIASQAEPVCGWLAIYAHEASPSTRGRRHAIDDQGIGVNWNWAVEPPCPARTILYSVSGPRPPGTGGIRRSPHGLAAEPWAHLFSGVVEQNYIYHVIDHATGWSLKLASNKSPRIWQPCMSAITQTQASMCTLRCGIKS